MFAKVFGLCVAVIAAVALASASSAASAKVHGGVAIDVSTRAAVVGYLRSIHINPRGVVIERGVRNYAGANCPGAGWNCTTTTHPVVQVASAGGRNTFLCSTAHCAVIQVAAPAAGTNKAKCVKTQGPGPTATQSCSITQSSASANNVAVVFENVPKSGGLTHTASSTASITQTATGASNGNTACVTQNITLDGSTGDKPHAVTVTLEAHQSVTITQDATGSGANSAQYGAKPDGNCDFGHALAQNQTLTSKATGQHGGVTQNENATGGGANLTIDIEQNQGVGYGVAAGTNNATFVQTNTLTAIAISKNGPIAQTQSSVNGGLLGTVNQDSSGVSTATTTQTEIQCEDAAKKDIKQCDTADPDFGQAPLALTQTQYGPVHKGVGEATQTGNTADTFSVTQTSIQNTDQGPGSSQTNIVQGDCHTSGNCTVTQTTNVDGETTTNTQSGPDVDTTTTCEGSTCTGGGTDTTGTVTPLNNGMSVTNTDIGEFGQGGMRGGDGTGTIAVSGITGPVLHAFLYWHGPTYSEDPDSNAQVTFNGQPITGTNIGTSHDNAWEFTNSQSYRADVTALVNGNGSYSLADFIKTGEGTIADINGVALIVFYDNGNSSDDRNVVLWNGNDSTEEFGDDPVGWDETIAGVPYSGGTASLDLVVGDGQSYQDAELDVNGNAIAGPGAVFDGAVGPNYSGNPENVSGSLWDLKSFDITGDLEFGSNDLEITLPPEDDALSLVVAIASTPVSSGEVIG